MLHAQNRNFKREFEHRTVTRILAIFSLIAASVLVFAIAPGSVSANRAALSDAIIASVCLPQRLPPRPQRQASHCRLLHRCRSN